MIYNKSLEKHHQLEQHIQALQVQLENFPDGKLICCHHGSECKWYRSDGHVKTYIPKSNKSLAEQLAIKKYLSLLLDDLSHEKRALEFYLKHHRSEISKSQRLLTDYPGYRELLSPYFKTLSEELYEWQHAPYPQNSSHPENLIHKSSSGHIVRSKSEAMIDHFLFTHRIPFRYECALELGNTVFYPDFTIRHPLTGETYFWEHFGLMDDSGYSRKAFSKMQIYNSYGFTPSIQLITTFETQANPLTPDTILKTMERYFL